MQKCSVSVIIPVFQHQAELAECLNYLKYQSYPKNLIEIVIVDNSADFLLQKQMALSSSILIRIIHEPKPGSYAARNAGVRTAQGAILAFTDADCQPTPDWIERGVTAVQANPAAGAIAGHIAVSVHDTERPTLAESFDQLYSYAQDEFVRCYDFGATANLFISRAMSDRVGEFDETLFSGGDRQWGQRAKALGFPVIYADEVRITHPARSSMLKFLNKTSRVAAGQWQMRVRQKRESHSAESRFLVAQFKVRHRKFVQTRFRSFGARIKFFGGLTLLHGAQLMGHLAAITRLGRFRT